MNPNAITDIVPISPDTVVQFVFLLPTGHVVNKMCNSSLPLTVLKQEIWFESQKLPLYSLMPEENSCIFAGITASDGNLEHFYDENKRLYDLDLLYKVLKVTELVGGTEERKLNEEIDIAIGHSVSNLDKQMSQVPESFPFRLSMLNVCKEAISIRKKVDHDFYAVPQDVFSAEEYLCPDNFRVHIWIWNTDEDDDTQRSYFGIDVGMNTTPKMIINAALTRQNYLTTSDDLVLKVAGRSLFFIDETPFKQFAYVRLCLSESRIPELIILNRTSISDRLGHCEFIQPSFTLREATFSGQAAETPTESLASLWDVDAYFAVTIRSASSVNVVDAQQTDLVVHVGLFHGNEQLVVAQSPPTKCTNPKWHSTLELMYCKDIPRATQVCFALTAIRKQGKEETLGWSNLRIVDHKERILCGDVSLVLHTPKKGVHGPLYPLGLNGSNTDAISSPRLEIRFEEPESQPCRFPPNHHIREYASFVRLGRRVDVSRNPLLPIPDHEVTPEDREFVKSVMSRDPLFVADANSSDNSRLWQLREFCMRQMPTALAQLLLAVQWDQREQFAQMYTLLDAWPHLPPNVAIELLDVRFPDPVVRQFAVQCLESSLSDQDLLLYFVSFIQVLKYEPFFDSPLIRMLLKRALLNQRVGHRFFWLLKSEQSYASNNWLRYALTLEAFCRGCGVYLKSLVGQVRAVEKMHKINAHLKSKKDDSTKHLLDLLRKPDNHSLLQNIESPLDNSLLLGNLIIEQCKIVSSAKKPLFLSYDNPDILASKMGLSGSAILFKSGDDLRQDMLTLQMIKLMDHIWKSHSHDWHLTPYDCLSMGKDYGLIEIVNRSKTLYEICYAHGRFNATQLALHQWICKHNKGSSYETALDNFTKSCVGYCVATFILGIRDRHPSNIMITEDAHLFHIDFGHFLGHDKKKMGINRERVPFVLTDEIVNALNRGSEGNELFQNFIDMCVEAYLCLHSNGNIFLTLFSMMLCMDIPELQEIGDINYLRTTLAIERSREDAEYYFRSQLNDAYKGRWTTHVNFFVHAMKHGTPKQTAS